MKSYWLHGVLILGAILFFCPAVFAHSDARDGPAAKAVEKALESGNVDFVLIWVRSDDEEEVKKDFERTVSVRKLGQTARELADVYFLETVVRLHLAAEGIPYTGLKPAGSVLEPVIPAADKAIEDNFLYPVLKLLSDSTEQNVRQRFGQVMAKKDFNPEDLEAGRQYVKSYEEFIHIVERIYAAATQPVEEH